MAHGADDGAATDNDPAWLSQVCDEAATEAEVPVRLLADYLRVLAAAAVRGERPQRPQLTSLTRLGRRAAELGIDADRVVDLYLSAAWRLWRAVPTGDDQDAGTVRGSAETVLRVVIEAMEALIDGHQAVRQETIRLEESARREFVDDLLRGDADVVDLVRRAQPFGLDLTRRHQVVLAALPEATPTLERAAAAMEPVVVRRFGDREVLAATKETFLVMIIPGEPVGDQQPVDQPPGAVAFLRDRLHRHTGNRHWQVAAGRPYPGAYGIARSYEEAREVLGLARRLNVDAGTLQPRDLLLYRVLGVDQAALSDLVVSLLGPLTKARGGAGPLLATLEHYFAAGAVATETARRMHVSVRTITYRLARIAALTGTDATDPDHQLALRVAVLGARLLDWTGE